jgi:signal peptide peptidase SppA
MTTLVRAVALLVILALLPPVVESSTTAASVQPATEKKPSGPKWIYKFQRSVREEKVPVPAKKEEEKMKPLFGGKPKKAEVEPEEEKEEVKPKPTSTGLFGFGSKKESKVDKPEELKKEEEEEKPKPGLFGFGAKKKKKPEKVDEKTDDPAKEPVKEPVVEEEKEKESAPVVNTTTPEEEVFTAVNATSASENKDANRTAAPPNSPFPFSSSSALQQLRLPMSSSQQQQRQPIIIMGLDGRPQRVPPTSSGSPRHPGQAAPTTALIAEALATVVSTGIRFWFLTSLTRWFADEEIKSLKKPTQHFVWERLNDRYTKDHEALETALRAPPANVGERKWRRHLQRELRKEQRLARRAAKANITTSTKTKKSPLTEAFQRTLVVVELAKNTDKGEVDFAHLEEVVTFILTEHRLKSFGKKIGSDQAVDLEIIILMESPGGGVSQFGLAAAQLQRLTAEDGITTTVCVDKVGASGGYMIASQANKILAAPFAAVGSIGVIREGLNFNKALEKYGVMPLVLTAGEAKAPLSTYGEVTKRGVEIAQKNLEKTHEAFRDLIVRGRPILADTIEEVADGDIFLGQEAKDLNLVDAIMTSEEYIMDRVQTGDRVLKLHRMPQFLKNRRFPNLHPLDFLKENGQQWLLKQDIPKLVSRVLQTTSCLKFIQYLIEKNGMGY